MNMEGVEVNFEDAIIAGAEIGMPLYNFVQLIKPILKNADSQPILEKSVERQVTEEKNKDIQDTQLTEEKKEESQVRYKKNKEMCKIYSWSKMEMGIFFDEQQAITGIEIKYPSIFKKDGKYYLNNNYGINEDIKFDIKNYKHIQVEYNGPTLTFIKCYSNNEKMKCDLKEKYRSLRDVQVKDNKLLFCIDSLGCDGSKELFLGKSADEIKVIFNKEPDSINVSNGIIVCSFYDFGIDILCNISFIIIGIVLHTNDQTDKQFLKYAQCHWKFEEEKNKFQFSDSWGTIQKDRECVEEKENESYDKDYCLYSLTEIPHTLFAVHNDRVLKIMIWNEQKKN
ncbi:hypothetical protein EDI_029550 [Entamoeba dispar SAW760]|uniref:Uncharacterized protein n=1 Tax=Entamoeba dispar (strain ATCC PRA-260 / SAW760) TaxID=370354 RepID=B0EV56_ENTDS|nr:uncharacterized protein EDI_029550 [Entamoeba dispar SAW760]EDR21596.1 hypothetical protein EDI_029550 [Entamoeba dispar SAW760]|eukprot:EDR21596.1 hypothetical protein EDI_029550 [Entamoeba dispar SAW760]